MTARTLLQRVARNSLVRNTSWQLFAEGGRLLVQSIAFVLIGRALGPEGIGAFAGAMALVFLFVPFAGWGSGHILIMHVARKPSSFAQQWGNALLLILVFGSLLTLLVLGLAAWFVSNLPLRIVLTLGIAEFMFGKLSDVSAQVFRAFEQMRGAAQQMLVEGVFRLVATVLYIVLTPVPSAQGWAVWYLAATILEALVGFAAVTWRFGLPRPRPSLIRNTLSDGWLFSINLASASIYNNIDKTMMAQLATFEATGIYATAYRIIDMAFIPAKSIVFATYPRFFKAGSAGIKGSLAFARRLLPFSLGSGLLITFGLFIIAPLTPFIFGQEYAAAVSAIRWLALIPLFRSLHNIAANTLTGAGHQVARSFVQVGVAVLNVLLNLWLIPRYSWQGAAWASLISDGTLALVLWPLCLLVNRRAGRAAKPPRRPDCQAALPPNSTDPSASPPSNPPKSILRRESQ
jgi:O-antigen/teichoic acid export membrane protein